MTIVQKLSAGTATMPSGTIAAYAGLTAPIEFLICEGQAVSRTTYADLFTAIGTIYGNGDGSSTFNIPDLRSEFIRSFISGSAVDPGRALGSNQGWSTALVGGTTISASYDNNTNFHSHSGITGGSGTHNHTIAADDDGGGGNASEGSGARDGSFYLIPEEGAHSHSNVASSSHGSHVHTLNVSSWGGGDIETRPDAVVVMYMIAI